MRYLYIKTSNDVDNMICMYIYMIITILMKMNSVLENQSTKVLYKKRLYIKVILFSKHFSIVTLLIRWFKLISQARWLYALLSRTMLLFNEFNTSNNSDHKAVGLYNDEQFIMPSQFFSRHAKIYNSSVVWITKKKSQYLNHLTNMRYTVTILISCRFPSENYLKW